MFRHFIVRSRTHLVSLHVPCNLIARVPLPLRKYPKALYLFTRSDLKTIILPTTVFAYLSAQDLTVGRILCAVLWTWLHLLQICVSNQSLNPGEDALNKPWRPIPSGIVSVLNARILRWILLPLCLSLSISLGALWQGISLAIAFIVYNELHLDTHWLVQRLQRMGLRFLQRRGFGNSWPIDNVVAYFNLICRQCPHNFLDNPCPGFPR